MKHILTRFGVHVHTRQHISEKLLHLSFLTNFDILLDLVLWAVIRAVYHTWQHGCVALRIGIELICSAADASEGLIARSASRIMTAAILATVCADCGDQWQLPIGPAGLYHAAAAAQETAVAVDVSARLGAGR